VQEQVFELAAFAEVPEPDLFLQGMGDRERRRRRNGPAAARTSASVPTKRAVSSGAISASKETAPMSDFTNFWTFPFSAGDRSGERHTRVMCK
jgi:hypothetical protein